MWYNNQAVKQRPVGQAAKTLASHAGNMGSIPVRVTKKERTDIIGAFFFDAVSLIGTAFALQMHGFENLTKAVGSLFP